MEDFLAVIDMEQASGDKLQCEYDKLQCEYGRRPEYGLEVLLQSYEHNGYVFRKVESVPDVLSFGTKLVRKMYSEHDSLRSLCYRPMRRKHV